MYIYLFYYFEKLRNPLLLLSSITMAHVQEYVYDNAAGNPKHIEEVVAQLRKFESIDVIGGRVVVHSYDFDKVSPLSPPECVQFLLYWMVTLHVPCPWRLTPRCQSRTRCTKRCWA